MKHLEMRVVTFPFGNYSYYFCLLFFFIINPIFSESYSEHRLDDKNYFTGGGKPLVNEGRIESSIPIKPNSSKEEIETREKKNGYATKQYLTTKFYSQKGGDKEDLAGRYANQFNYSPEIVGYKKDNHFKYMLLASPLISYREDFQLKRNINRLIDTELIASGKWERKIFSINVEGGRGFQRLDTYGVLFNGMANYVESNLFFKPLDIRFSLLALSYNYGKENFSFRTNKTNDKLLGGNLLFQSVPFIRQIHFFMYHIFEPNQIAERQTVQEDKKFKPKGEFIYKGIELKTKEFLSLTHWELGIFSVSGYRDYAEYPYQQYNNISKTKGLLSYLTLNLTFGKWLLRTGGLYSTKDKSSSLNRSHNGYSSLLSDVKIFGGKSSFLLMETKEAKNGTLFREFDSTRENSYDTKGMELASIGLSYNIQTNFQITGILNHVNSNLGIGNEGILSVLYHFSKSDTDNSGFLLISTCIARVNPVTKKKVIYDEFRVDPDLKEFTRFYISGGIHF